MKILNTSKKFLCVIIAILLTAAFTGCRAPGTPAEKDGEATTINVYNWGEYIDLSVLDEFTEQTGINVNYTTYASNEEMYAKIISGAAMYDVIIPSEYMIAKMIDENLLAELDFDNIPNYKYIGGSYKGLAYDPQEKYSVPYTWGTVVIVYNTKFVDEEDAAEESIDLLWNEKYAGNILMFDNPRDAFALAHTKLGHSMNTSDPQHWQQAADELMKQKPLVQSYVMDQVFDKMINEEAYIAPYYAGDALTMFDGNENLAAYVPSEGANLFFDSMCVLKSSRHKQEAEQFINFMCGTETAKKNAEEICYATPHNAARELLEPEQRDDTMIYPPEEVLDRCEVFINLDDKTLELQSKLWIDLKTSYAS